MVKLRILITNISVSLPQIIRRDLGQNLHGDLVQGHTTIQNRTNREQSYLHSVHYPVKHTLVDDNQFNFTSTISNNTLMPLEQSLF